MFVYIFEGLIYVIIFIGLIYNWISKKSKIIDISVKMLIVLVHFRFCMFHMIQIYTNTKFWRKVRRMVRSKHY